MAVSGSLPSPGAGDFSSVCIGSWNWGWFPHSSPSLFGVEGFSLLSSPHCYGSLPLILALVPSFLWACSESLWETACGNWPLPEVLYFLASSHLDFHPFVRNCSWVLLIPLGGTQGLFHMCLLLLFAWRGFYILYYYCFANLTHSVWAVIHINLVESEIVFSVGKTDFESISEAWLTFGSYLNIWTVIWLDRLSLCYCSYFKLNSNLKTNLSETVICQTELTQNLSHYKH